MEEVNRRMAVIKLRTQCLYNTIPNLSVDLRLSNEVLYHNFFLPVKVHGS